MRAATAILVAALAAACRGRPDVPSSGGWVDAAATRAAQPPSAAREFYSYVADTARTAYPAGNAAGNAVIRCVEGDDAPATAADASACLAAAVPAVRPAVEFVRTYVARPAVAAHHARLVAIANREFAALERFAQEFARRVPALDRARRGRPLPAWWGDDEGQLSGSLRALVPLSIDPTWAAWTGAMDDDSNRLLRCVDLAQQPMNCGWARVYRTVTGDERGVRVLLADETTLPPFHP
jgi:hypothetical protein